MHLTTRNVNTALRELVSLFAGNYHQNLPALSENRPSIVSRPSRNGNVLVIDEPVTVTYTNPTERVLFNAARDANPFSLLYESLWMLAGRNDVAPLAYYTKRFAEFSDDGRTLNGAYGYRWRNRYDYYVNEVFGQGQGKTDQLDLIVQHLKADPTSRRAVLQMWNVEDDLLKIGKEPCSCGGSNRVEVKQAEGIKVTKACTKCLDGLTFGSKDVCCNLSVMFSIRHVPHHYYDGGPDCGEDQLEVTVTNRSNDLIWGLLGANYVTFSVLQEYVAARLGVAVGKYHHFTSNLHCYIDRPDWKPEELLADEGEGYGDLKMSHVPLVHDPEAFEKELPLFVEDFSNGCQDEIKTDWEEPFFKTVGMPMMLAFYWHKERLKCRSPTNNPLDWVDLIKSDDWRVAARGWLERRAK
jgi:thymidylate synthase